MQYEVNVTAKRKAVLGVDATISQVVAYVPRSRPAPPSRDAIMALREGRIRPGPDEDAEGWQIKSFDAEGGSTLEVRSCDSRCSRRHLIALSTPDRPACTARLPAGPAVAPLGTTPILPWRCTKRRARVPGLQGRASANCFAGRGGHRGRQRGGPSGLLLQGCRCRGTSAGARRSGRKRLGNEAEWVACQTATPVPG